MAENRPSLKKAALILCGAYLLHFLIFYIPVYVIESEAVFFEYLRYALEIIIRFSVPVVLSALLLKHASALGRWKALTYAPLLSLPSLVFNLPYYYLYATAFGNDWQESLLYSLLLCLIELIILAVNVALVFLLAHTVACAPLKKELISALPPKKREGLTKEEKARIADKASSSLAETYTRRGIFDFSVPYVKGIFFGAFLEFIFYILREIADIISHLLEYGDFTTSEIMYIMTKFIVIFTMLFASHAVSYLLSIKTYTEDSKNASV